MKEKIFKKGFKRRAWAMLIALTLVLSFFPCSSTLVAAADKKENWKGLVLTTNLSIGPYIQIDNIASVSVGGLTIYRDTLDNSGTYWIERQTGWSKFNDEFFDRERTTGELFVDGSNVLAICVDASNDSSAHAKIDYYNWKCSYCGAIIHEHEWFYSADDKTLTAMSTCHTNSSCEYNESGGKTATLTLTASSPTYSGTAYNEASLGDTSAWTGAGLAVPTIEYYQGETKLDSAPVNAGSYTAKATADGKTASVDFTINKADQTISAPTASSKTTASVTLTTLTGNGATKYGYNTTNTAPESWSSSNIISGLSANTTYYFFAKFEGNDNYNPVTSIGAAITTGAHTCSNGVKQDGKVATCTEAGWKDYYKCGSCDKLYEETACTTEITNIDTWKTTTEKGKIAKLGHNWGYSANGAELKASCSRKATCGQADVKLTLTASSENYSGSAATITIGTETEKTAWTGAGLTVPTTITYAKADGTALTAAPTTAGHYVAKVSPFGEIVTDTNTAKVSYTISKAEPSATEPTAVSSLTYTGTAQDLITAGSTSDGTLQYAVNTTQTKPADNTFSDNIPQGTAVGTYYVYYKVVGNDEHSDKVFETPVTVSIGKGTIPDAKKPTSGKTVYVSSGKTTAQTGTVTLDTLGISTTDIPGAAIKSVTEKTDDNNIISSISSASYTTATSLTVGHTATLTVTIESTNYTDFRYDLTVEAKAKTDLTIDGLSAPATNPAYSGNPVAKTIFGTATISGTTTEVGEFTAADLKYTYEGRDDTPYEASTTAPTNVGKYKVTIAVPDTNENYSGSQEFEFEIVRSTPAAPNAIAVAPTSATTTDGKITGVDTTMEYATYDKETSAYGDYTAVTGTEIANLAAGTKIKVRVKETDNNNRGTEKELTVPAYSAPSGGGGYSGGGSSTPSTPSSSTETISVLVNGEAIVKVDASVKDGNADVKEITATDIDKINANAATGTETTTVTIDFSGAKQDVHSVTLTKTTVDTLAKATADTSNKVDSVEIKLSKATVTLDEKAIGAVNEQAKGDKVSIKVEDRKTTDLNTTQQTAIKDMNVVDSFVANIESKGLEIHDFKGGNVNVTIAFVVPTGKKANHYFVYYVADNGTIEKFSTNVSNGKLTFTTTHFSDYVIVYDETMENDTDKPAEETPSTDDSKPAEDTSVDKTDADKVVITAKQKAANKKALEKSFTVKASKSKVTVKWGKVKKADGYNVYASYDGKKYTKVKTIKNAKTTSYTIKKLAGKKINTKKKVKIYVVAYKTVDGSKKQFGKTKVLTTKKIK